MTIFTHNPSPTHIHQTSKHTSNLILPLRKKFTATSRDLDTVCDTRRPVILCWAVSRRSSYHLFLFLNTKKYLLCIVRVSKLPSRQGRTQTFVSDVWSCVCCVCAPITNTPSNIISLPCVDFALVFAYHSLCTDHLYLIHFLDPGEPAKHGQTFVTIVFSLSLSVKSCWIC